MIKIRPVQYDDPERDRCHDFGVDNTTVAVLEVDGVYIPLCMKCVYELTESLTQFNNTTFCYKCGRFTMSRSGWNYGGSCQKRAGDEVITEQNAGYIGCVNCMDTCGDSIPKINFVKENENGI